MHPVRIRLLCLLLVTPLSLGAQESTNGDGDGDGDETTLEPAPAKATWSLGFGTVFSPRPYVGTRAQVFPVPLVEYSRGGFFVRGIYVGYGFARDRALAFEVFAGPNFRGYRAGDSVALEGMADRETTGEIGGRLLWRPRPIQIQLSAVTDVFGVHRGQEVELELARDFNIGPRVRLVPAVSGIWQSSNYTDYYYGVDDDEARPDRPTYTAGASLSARAGLRMFFAIDARWSLLAWTLFEAYGTEITDSPIVEDSTALGGFLGLTYRFGKSGSS